MSTSKRQLYNAFGAVPASVPPSMLVRYWHEALLVGPLVFLVVFYGLTWLTYRGGTPIDDLPAYWSYHAGLTLQALIHYLTGGIVLREAAWTFWAEVRPMGLLGLLRLAGPLAVALAASGWLSVVMLRPRSNERHLKGPRLLSGKEAVEEARRRSLTPKERKADPYHLALHPALILPKSHWSRHTLIYGSVGAGKTQVLLPWIDQILRRDDKLFLYDVKGDFTSYFRKPIIVSPFDARSYVWDVGRDVRTSTQANAFAQTIIPEDQGGSSNKFFSVAAQQLLVGALRKLQNERGIDWSWPDLAREVSRSAEEMVPDLLKHYAKAAPLIANAESQTTSSVLATLSSYTRIIDDLALAWPRIGKRRFAITDWVQDGYRGRKQVIVQAGGDAQLTRAYIAAMINVAVPEIISPRLPDNESGRFIGFFIDEMTSIGRLNIGPLVDKGRSKGVVCVFALQDLAQLRQVYGDNEATAIQGMVGTHIICRVQMGETREKLAKLLGKRKVAVMPHGPNAVVREEGKDVLHADDLTDRLGFARGKQFGKHGWGIRAIVQMGHDPLLLDFPGQQFPVKRDGQVPAKWTIGPAGIEAGYVPELTAPAPTKKALEETVAVLGRGLSAEQIEEMLR